MTHLTATVRRPRYRRALARGIWGLAVWVAGAMVIAAAGLRARPQPADLALVLGNAVDTHNRPKPPLEARLQAALALYQRGACRTVMVSGGITRDGRNEAAGMYHWLVAHGVPADAIVTDSAGDNTRASARHAAAWLRANDAHGVIAVSQFYHLPRAQLALAQAGITGVSGDYPHRWFGSDLYAVMRETPGYIVYALRLR